MLYLNVCFCTFKGDKFLSDLVLFNPNVGGLFRGLLHLIVCTSFSAGGLILQPNFQKEERGLTRPQLLEEVAGREEGDFFQGVAVFK